MLTTLLAVVGLAVVVILAFFFIAWWRAPRTACDRCGRHVLTTVPYFPALTLCPPCAVEKEDEDAASRAQIQASRATVEAERKAKPPKPAAVQCDVCGQHMLTATRLPGTDLRVCPDCLNWRPSDPES